MMDLNLLPKTAQDIVAVLGVSDAITVLSKLAGTKWEVPPLSRSGGKTGQQLMTYLGEPLALRFMQAFGGESISIPRCQKAINSMRNAAMIARFEELVRTGMTVRLALVDIALHYNLTTTYVWQIVNAIPDTPTDNQLKLF